MTDWRDFSVFLNPKLQSLEIQYGMDAPFRFGDSEKAGKETKLLSHQHHGYDPLWEELVQSRLGGPPNFCRDVGKFDNMKRKAGTKILVFSPRWQLSQTQPSALEPDGYEGEKDVPHLLHMGAHPYVEEGLPQDLVASGNPGLMVELRSKLGLGSLE